jgi:dual specificity phosphatase 12
MASKPGEAFLCTGKWPPRPAFVYQICDLVITEVSAMGKSRSAAIVVAYLMYKYEVTPTDGLEQLREGREVCGPNLGFMEQLETFYRMLRADNEDQRQSIYNHWSVNRFYGEAWEWERRANEARAKL